MSILNDKYKKITEQRKNISIELKELLENESVKRYFELCSKDKNLAFQQREVYENIKNEQYLKCNHIWVNTLKDYDSYEGRTETYCGCIKCGLDERVIYMMEYNPDCSALTEEQKIMYKIMNDCYYKKGINTNVDCNLELAMAIYKRIKEIYPNIQDGLARKYFEIALDNIRNIQVNDERKKSRAKRLSLNENFNRWD